MKSSLPKVLHPICGSPMLSYVLELVEALRFRRVVTVLGHGHQEVRSLLPAGMRSVIQKKRLGTADAVRLALAQLRGFKGTVVVLYGDTPLLKPDTLHRLIKHHTDNRLDVTMLTATLDDPAEYGRVVRDTRAAIRGVIEDRDARSFQREIKEVNTGIICFNKERLNECLRAVRPNNRKHEYYLTDVIGIAYRKGYLIESVTLKDINEAMGINSRADLAKANAVMRRRINEYLLQQGVTIVEPQFVFIDYCTKIGRDSTIYPFTVIERGVTIGRRCSIGPFAHLREGTRIADDVVVGNFIEIVRSRLSARTWVKHFGYLGDASVGKNVNIGAGCVTANFDGKKKYKTVIGDGAFIGSDTVLVAPVSIGRSAKTGAGSVVLKRRNVPAGEVVAGVPARPLRKRQR